MSVVDLEQLRPLLARLGRDWHPADVADAMRSTGQLVTDHSLRVAVDQLRRESEGAGVLEPLLRSEGVTDVLVNGAGEVWWDRGEGLERAPVRFDSEEQVRSLAVRLAGRVGRRLDDAAPWVDARLPDGTRLHAVLSPVAAPGTCLSLRIPSARRLALADWLAHGSMTPAVAEILRAMVTGKVAHLVSGGTGSGKTTLLGSLLAEVPATERLVVVEDSRELDPDHPHCVRLEGRSANAEGRGAVTMTTLVRQALRMRPDRVVVGEVRGAELCDLLMALNTGHEGGCGTVHANSAEDVPARLEALAALGGLERSAAHAQIVAALDVVVHVKRVPGRRVVDTIGVVERSSDGEVAVVPALYCHPEVRRGPGARQLERRLGC